LNPRNYPDAAVNAALAARVAALEAERLAPVPRASHAIAVDVDDLALLTAFIADVIGAARLGRRPDIAMSGDTSVAWQRLDAAVRGHARTAALPDPAPAGGTDAMTWTIAPVLNCAAATALAIASAGER
jgi:hypothetical protein